METNPSRKGCSDRIIKSAEWALIRGIPFDFINLVVNNYNTEAMAITFIATNLLLFIVAFLGIPSKLLKDLPNPRKK